MSDESVLDGKDVEEVKVKESKQFALSCQHFVVQK